MTILHDHDPNWKNEFLRLEEVYHKALGDLITRIEHVGSTAILGIAAKPILDIDLVIENRSILPEVCRRLEQLGYKHRGDLGIPEREAFKGVDSEVPHLGPNRNWMKHHLYVCAVDNRELQRHTLFRDHLNQYLEARKEYESIKKDIEARSNGDHLSYIEIKENEGTCTRFVERILKLANKAQRQP